MKPDNKAGGPWLYALGLVPVIWFALLIAPAISGGLSEIVSALPAAMNHPFKIVWCEDSVKTVLIFIAAYGLGIGIYLSSRRNYRRGEEHGSAKWGDPRAVNKKYRDKDPFKNRIFTQHVRMGLDGRKHRRTLNTLVCGGSGAGKIPPFGSAAEHNDPHTPWYPRGVTIHPLTWWVALLPMNTVVNISTVVCSSSASVIWLLCWPVRPMLRITPQRVPAPLPFCNRMRTAFCR